MAQPLSVVLVVHNAEAQLPACLASVPFADEVVVVDSGSSDGTAACAGQHGARVLQRDWMGFGLQKQFAVAQARNDWVLCLDADERVSPELERSIRAALEAPVAPVYRMRRRNRFLGRWLSHGEGYPDWSTCMFDRRNAAWSDDPVHEKVLYSVTPGTLAGDLLHESAEDIANYLQKQNRYSTLAAQQLFERGHNGGAFQLVLSPFVRFTKFYILRLGFLDGLPGLVHTSIGCASSFMKYAKLIELTRTRNSK